jgi:hypothetical protein
MSETLAQKIHKWAHLICSIGFNGGILVALVILAFISYSLAFNDTVRQDGPLTVERARQIGCPISLPDSAQKVRFAYVHDWFTREAYVRFDASADDCRDQAKIVFQDHEANKTLLLPHTEFEPVTNPPKIDVSGEIGPLRLLNVERIVDGVVKTDRTGRMTIWIDDDKGVFYCKITD